MKYVILLGDGMADRPSSKNGFTTALEVADIPAADAMASQGVLGTVQTVPVGMKPGSDVANLSVLGYRPELYYTGRSPIEALSMGIDYDTSDVAYRTNLVCVSGPLDAPDTVMLSHSAGDITTAEAGELLSAVSKALQNPAFDLFTGVSYRHCLILRHADTGADLTPPHDIINKKIAEYLPKGKNGALLLDLMKRAESVLRDHPVNRARVKRGLLPANSLWFWGEGRKPNLPQFSDKYGLKGAMVAAVDLLKGIAVGSGMTVVDVPGATGNEYTDYGAKGRACLTALQDHDLVFVHVEAPDECGHVGNHGAKVRAIEDVVEKILSPVMSSASKWTDGLSVMLLPDHATPVELMTHTGEAVPFAIWRSTESHAPTGAKYTEAEAQKTGVHFESGEDLIKYFLQK